MTGIIQHGRRSRLLTAGSGDAGRGGCGGGGGGVMGERGLVVNQCLI